MAQRGITIEEVTLLHQNLTKVLKDTSVYIKHLKELEKELPKNVRVDFNAIQYKFALAYVEASETVAICEKWITDYLKEVDGNFV